MDHEKDIIKNFKGIFIPKHLLDSTSLTISEASILCTIKALECVEHQGCCIAPKDIIKLMFIKAARMYETLRRLEERGYLDSKTPYGGRRILKTNLNPEKKEDTDGK